MEDEINTSQCTVCFGTYEDDVVERTSTDWLECACNRWLHEECVMNVVIDPDRTGETAHCALISDILYFVCIDT